MRFEDIPHNLVERARDGHPDALEEFCLMVQPGAYAILISILRNNEDAHDALQESLIRMIRFLPNLRDVKSLPGWIMRILVNQAHGIYRQRSTPVIDVSQMDESAASDSIAHTSTPGLSSLEAAENAEILKLINHAVTTLPDRQRTALVLFEIEQLSIREVAEAMDLTDGAVKFHLHEARKNMRFRLQQLGVPNAQLIRESRS